MKKRQYTENTNLAAKLELRRMICLEIDGPLRVLDCCAAGGRIWSALGAEFRIESYLPIDRKPAMSGTLRADSRQTLRVLDLSRFNVIDVDTYGEPWGHLMILADRLPDQTTAVFLTHGFVASGGGCLSLTARGLMGIPRAWRIPQHPRLLKLSASFCLQRGCEAFRILHVKRYTLRRVSYYGLLILGRKGDRDGQRKTDHRHKRMGNA